MFRHLAILSDARSQRDMLQRIFPRSRWLFLSGGGLRFQVAYPVVAGSSISILRNLNVLKRQFEPFIEPPTTAGWSGFDLDFWWTTLFAHSPHLN